MDDKKKWTSQTGVDQDRASKFSKGFAAAANDNPVSNAYAWLKKQVSDKKPQDEQSGG